MKTAIDIDDFPSAVWEKILHDGNYRFRYVQWQTPSTNRSKTVCKHLIVFRSDRRGHVCVNHTRANFKNLNAVVRQAVGE